MPLSHISKVFAVTDAKIAVMTADVPGSATTYGTSLDVPGIKSVGLSGNIESKVLRGDNGPLDADSVLTEVEIEVEHAKLSLDVLAAFLALTVTDAGTTPNQTATLALTGTSPIKFNKFKLSAVSASADPVAGNVGVAFYKCVLSEFPDLGLAEEDYQTVSFKAKCYPCLGTGQKWLDLSINETALALT